MAIESSNAQRLTAVMSTTSAIAVLMSFLTKRAEASSDIVSLDDATLRLLAAMAVSIDNIDNDADLLADILSAIQNLSISGAGIAPNNRTIYNSTVVGVVAVKAYQFPDLVIPEQRALVIKGYPLNGGLSYIGRSAAECTNWQQAWPLRPNESIAYNIKNAKELWVSFQVANESVVFTVEQD
jgi:hypothetical protein